MADIRAGASGDFSATATWVGGVVPGLGDIAYSNGFTVTISDARTVQAINNASGGGAVAGGTFSLLNGCNLTCTNANGVVQGATATSIVTTPSLLVGSTASVAANCELLTASGFPLNHNGGGTLNWTGNFSKGNIGNILFALGGTGILNITGNITSLTSNIRAIDILAAGTLNITGSMNGLMFAATTAGATINLTGFLAPTATGAAVINTSTAILTHIGTAQSSATHPVFGAGSAAQNTRISGPILLGASGNINPVQAQSWRWAPTQIPTFMEVVQSDGSAKRSLYTADNMPAGGHPATGNVRQGTVYGPSNEFIGTLAVPPVSSVANGTPVDNTVGTAILTGANVLTALGMATGNLDNQLSNKATVDQVAAIVQGATSA